MHPGTPTVECGTLCSFHWLGIAFRLREAAGRRVAFLLLSLGAGLLLVQPCAGGSGVFEPTGSLVTGRSHHRAILLPNGKVFVEASDRTKPESPELYDIASGIWTDTGIVGAGYWEETATLLPNGKVLVAGGIIFYGDVGVSFAGSELYDPVSGTWITTGSLSAARNDHTATLLPNGKVLVAGGFGNARILASAELYDPASGTWMATGNLSATRYGHTATLLPNGKVLVAGGFGATSALASADLYDPANGTWTPTGSLATGRNSHTATLLPSGKVLVAGGFRTNPGPGGVMLASAELYDPGSRTWMATGNLGVARQDHTATLLPNGQVLVAGGYGGTGTGSLASAELYVGQPPPPTLLNISTRLRVQTGDNVGIGGFIITGTVPKHVLLRAIGPSLTQFGVPDPLGDPVLELHGPGAFVTLTNNNWRDTQEAEIQATGLAPSNDLESAIVATLAPGAYTGIVKGNLTPPPPMPPTPNPDGVALIEVYDLNPSAVSKLANMSTRAFVSTGANVVIAGFILGGNSGATSIVLRGIGPSLSDSGVPDPLADPTLELRDSNGALIMRNDNWQDDPSQAAIISAAGLAPRNAFESGIAVTLAPGPYTAFLAGLNNDTGVGLVEAYDLGAP